ncbi:MAG: hypothetical protein AAF528_08005 [Cyanobacteria bacterium P01_C01_bin.121]
MAGVRITVSDITGKKPSIAYLPNQVWIAAIPFCHGSAGLSVKAFHLRDPTQ